MAAQPSRGPALRRRTVLLTLAGASLALPAAAATLPAASALPSELALALRAGQPLVVMVSTEGCPFCKVVRDHYLAPLRQGSGLIVVQLDLGSRRGIVDFAGGASTHDELLRQWRVQVAPTLLFFGTSGREVAPRLIGLSPDFYGAYLDQRLAQARREL